MQAHTNAKVQRFDIYMGIVVTVVKDIAKSTEFLTSALGLGPWEIAAESTLKEDMIIGEPFSIKVATAKLGPVVLELVQPLDDRSVWAHFLKDKGEGLYNIAVGVSNWDAAVSKLQACGNRMVLAAFDRTTFSEPRRWCLFDAKPGELIVEFIECREENELVTSLCPPSNTDANAISSLEHIGVVVKDMDKTTKFLSSTLGLGPWDIFEYSTIKDEVTVGEPFRVKTAHTNLGPTILELLQPLDEGSIWVHLLKTKGEGLHNIAFNVSNYDEWVSKLQGQGATIVLGAIFRGKRWCYLDTKVGGITFELIEA
ncbi:VOC family protein [Chloroflexota bacterium]